MSLKDIDRTKAIEIIDLCENDEVRNSLIKLLNLDASMEEIKDILIEAYSVDFNEAVIDNNVIPEDEIINYNLENNMERTVIAVALSYTIGKQYNEYNHKTVDVDRIDEVLDHVLIDGSKTLNPKIDFMKGLIQGYIKPNEYSAALSFANKYPCNYGTYNKYIEIKNNEKQKRKSK